MSSFEVLMKCDGEPVTMAKFATCFAAVCYAQDVGATWVSESGDNGADIIVNGQFTKYAFGYYPKTVRAFPWFVNCGY